ncbi:hypothetical protein CK203_045553 [Vitis vinifera]|uniref:Uncharacterized protein n=1 Tax=Vitis vinifera TaxID=29760 RepID=A0A438HLD5_VITVI|nr:hypothetical protein CK203_045553 [Vitis vinifera]
MGLVEGVEVGQIPGILSPAPATLPPILQGSSLRHRTHKPSRSDNLADPITRLSQPVLGLLVYF